MKSRLGFTLIEILVALSLFAILAMLTSSIMYYVFETRTRLTQETERLSAWQLAITLLQRSITELVERPVYVNNEEVSPAFIGQSNQVEFTYGGLVNPGSIEKRSHLQRIAWICRNHQLVQRTWPKLDFPKRDRFEEKTLLTDVNCQFSYLDVKLHLLPYWPPGNVLPKAIQFSANADHFDKASFLFIIPKVLYEPPPPA